MHKNIIFDCGGVLHHWNPFDLAYSYTKNVDDANYFVENLFPKWHYLDMGMSDEDFYELMKSEFDSKYHEVIKDIIFTWTDHFSVHEDMMSVVKELKKNHNLYMLSNMPYSFVKKAKESHEFDMFDSLFFSCEYKMIKPDIEFYKKLLETNNLDPKDCLYIDDLMDNLIPAKSLGIDTYLFNIKEIDKFIDYINKCEKE